MTKDDYRTIAFVGAVFVLMLLKSVYFPCNCAVEPPNPSTSRVIAEDPEIGNIPAEGMVTLVDLGATDCIPCKMMAPVLEELETEYRGKAHIVFIDVKKHPEQAGEYGIRTIPTQIFYDANGAEVHRHTGFLDKKRIKEVLSGLGVPDDG